MPSSPVHYQYGMGTGCDQGADLMQVKVHRARIGAGENQRRSGVTGRTNRAEYVRPLIALIAQRHRAAAAFGPAVSQAALLTNPGFVLPPEFDRPPAHGFGNDLCDELGEVFLCVSWAAASALGCRGRTEI